MILTGGFEEYLLTIGIITAFVGLAVSVILGRKIILDVFKRIKLKRIHLLAAIIIILVFLLIELYVVKPTQLLFFDDAIYQAMALDLFHTGQAWMCDYGSPTSCFIGEIFHEPIGTSFNLAIGFALFGVSSNVAYAVGIFLTCVSIVMVFLVALLLFKDVRAALFSELLMALSPIVLIWARPTTSDMSVLAYSLIALFFMLIFLNKKNWKTLAMLLFSIGMLSYMKVDALLLVPILIFGYIILDDKSVWASIKKNYEMAKKSLSNVNVLLLLLLFVICVAPEFMYAYTESVSGNYGYSGTNLQDTCASSMSTMASGNFNIQNFEYNLCSNVYFWFDQYSSQYIIQPILFTLLAVLGAASMFFVRRKELLFIGVWFIAFFVLYTSFYAGSATYGVDWRFLLSMIAQASLFGGFGCIALMEMFDGIAATILKSKRYKHNKNKITLISAFIILIAIFYSTYLLLPLIGVNPSSIQQAGDARFYENFVYNDSYLIPSDCAVFTYDPTLFNINNRTALQLSYIYNQSMMANLTKQYSCLVVDYGYWCYTPNNLCTSLSPQFTLKNIVNTTYVPFGKKFGFYYVENATT
jgi:4-amino-4-deoxy-L-arabinose transferase-like glycosyltransferase